MTDRYSQRIGHSVDLNHLLKKIASDFNLGSLKSRKILEVGYEDFNIVINAEKGNFLAKIFGNFRSDKEIARYIQIMLTVIKAGINFPRVRPSNKGEYLFRYEDGVKGVVLEFIEGKTYFETKTIPTNRELNQVMIEAIKIHQLPIRPHFIFDSWAIPSINQMFNKVSRSLSAQDKKLVNKAIDIYLEVDKAKLTTCFVHGDIISTNTLKGEDNKIWILDFAVANIYPKIQELAVIATSLLGKPNKLMPIKERAEIVKKAYISAGGELTRYEKLVLLDYAVAGAAMEFMGGYKSKFLDKEDASESEFWLNIGRETLREAFFTR